MSILLDAVTKEKQQQMGELPDAVLTPRANYQHVASHNAWLKYVVLFLVILVGIASAWGLSKLISPANNTNETSNPVKAAANELVNRSNTQNTAMNETAAAPVSTEVRIANKVALPIAKPLSQVNSSTQFVSNQTVSNQTASAKELRPSEDVVYDYRLNNNRGEVTPSQAKPVEPSTPETSKPATSKAVASNSGSDSNNDRQLTAAELQALYGDDAIILGANSNYKKPSELEALRMKVSAAASDVNYEQQSQQTPLEKSTNSAADNSNNLMAAFEAALKEVEYENSANAPMTEEKLDPIPSPKKDEIPPYGQLPASVQLQVPEFNIQAHVYSSAAESRWLNVDGEELQEGDRIKGKLEIIEIRPRDVVLEIDGSRFKVPAI
ncbi:general secretion pathway protein GspB [Shewanella olleyana]|uniref:general secretion pathway protein GspB n=1 Tax=Shewanella olleyana TaxID=135626 RepID=UPI00200D8967|nr:general secretion pathway protein GspB [Shewanella olleyana]MCL1067255.1 general secretion pathway protein GspB [Shewanella olleyana]